MLCYAWDVLSITDDIKVGSDDYEDAYNLLAQVFSFGIGRLIRSGFHRSYILEEEELSTLRGKILVQESINRMSMERNRLICQYDEYSANDTFNQILKYTMDSLLKNPGISIETKRTIKKQMPFFDGIDLVPPTKSNRQKLIFNRNNVIYKLLISVASMLYENTSINEEDGSSMFKDFFRQEQMHRVFELFILRFYKTHLNSKIYKVHAPKIKWHIDDEAADIYGGLFDIDNSFEDRRTDIVIENNSINLQMIFDAKYYQKTFVQGYMNSEEDRVRTSHLNQVRGYLLDSDFEGRKVGALIYPMVNNNLASGSMRAIQDAHICIKTINLNTDWKNIEKDLLEFVKKFETGENRRRSRAEEQISSILRFTGDDSY